MYRDVQQPITGHRTYYYYTTQRNNSKNVISDVCRRAVISMTATVDHGVDQLFHGR